MSALTSPELTRLAEDVRDWSVAELRPLARVADHDHDSPQAAQDAFRSAPFHGSPASGLIELDQGSEVPEGRYQTSTVVTESGVYGDMLFMSANPGGGIGGKVVELIGTPAQVDRWTGGMARGEFTFSGFALTESGVGSDAAALASTARLDGDRWILNGSKMFCSGGAISDFVVAFATIDRSLGYHGIRAFVVEKGTPGFSVAKPNEDKLGCRSMLTSELLFDDVSVPIDHCLGSPEDQPASFRTALSALNTTRHQVASMACGIAQATLDEVTRLLRAQRLGYSIARWSRIESDLEAMGSAVERARLLARRAAWLIDQGKSFDRESAMAKAYAPPIAERVCLRAMTLLGPDAWSEDLLLEKWYRDVKILDIWEGTGQIQRRTISRGLFATRAASD